MTKETDYPPTAGPWHYSGGAVYSRLDADGYGMTRDCVAMRCGHDLNEIPPTERDSNMRLCAAAPELFAALCRLLASPDVNLDSLEPETVLACEQARGALAKAVR